MELVWVEHVRRMFKMRISVKFQGGVLHRVAVVLELLEREGNQKYEKRMI